MWTDYGTPSVVTKGTQSLNATITQVNVNINWLQTHTIFADYHNLRMASTIYVPHGFCTNPMRVTYSIAIMQLY